MDPSHHVLLHASLVTMVLLVLQVQGNYRTPGPLPSYSPNPANDETPQVIFLRRQVRNYADHEKASVTIVFLSRHIGEGGLTTRWFRPAPNQNLPYAELSNKLPAEGDDRYVVNTISAGNVVASTLVIKNIRVRGFPHEYSLIIKVTDHPMQYLVTTRVTRVVLTTEETFLDGIHWLRLPTPTVSFGYNGQFTVVCRAEIDRESQNPFLDELHMYRTYIERDSRATRTRTTRTTRIARGTEPRWGHLVSVSCGAIHRDRDNYVEEAGKYKQVGRRFVNKRIGIAEFELVFSVRNATREDQGMFSCAMERAADKAYVSAWVTQGSLSTKPLAEFIPCEAHSFDWSRMSLIAESRKETCFRCRGFGYPLPQVAVWRAGAPLLPSSGRVLRDRHVNVADGGLAEVTYTFLDPTYEDNAAYECRVRNAIGEASFKFHLIVM